MLNPEHRLVILALECQDIAKELGLYIEYGKDGLIALEASTNHPHFKGGAIVDCFNNYNEVASWLRGWQMCLHRRTKIQT